MDEDKKKKFLGLGVYTPVWLFYYYVSKQYDYVYRNNSSNYEAFVNLKRFGSFYFTGWNFTAQVYFLVIAIIHELSHLLGIPQNVSKYFGLIRHYLFTAIVFPCTMMVSFMFWGLYLIDRELVFPRSLDKFYPSWMTHSVHSFIILPIIAEINLPKEHGFEIIDFYHAVPVLTAFIISYEVSLITIYLVYGVWLYPIFKYLTWLQRLSFLIIVYSITVLLLYLGIFIQHLKKSKRVKFANTT
ncbi:androgen-dependent TFPI-regulating protein-like [Tribolium madens]|uniref:androgen-dependent TFPI-regulating protein-like n=1 Tax=Tribolium madens TaxID=41895 RepID=UPI001CF7399F|nr:androgen-dependent TFPI-regulating protein-like [Tribolium madens]